MPQPIPLGSPTFDDAELAAVARVLDSGWVAGQGPVGGEFEREFARLAGAEHAVAVSNCTAALHLSLLALGIGPGDEVIVADYTFPATGHSVLYVGARPRFVDVRPDIWTADPAAVEAALSPATRAIIAVDAFGQCADYEQFRKIADRAEVALIADAACATGATYHDRPAGSHGDTTCFSLHGRKGVTSGEGGVVTTDDPDLADTIRSLSSFGAQSAYARQAGASFALPRFELLGYNYKLSDIQAAIALVQIGKLPDLVARRREVASRYADRFREVAGVRVPSELPDRRTVWQSYVLTLDETIDRDGVIVELRRRGVQSNIGTYASHLLPVYGDAEPCPVSASLFRSHLAIPMHANLSDHDVDRVGDTVADVLADLC